LGASLSIQASHRPFSAAPSSLVLVETNNRSPGNVRWGFDPFPQAAPKTIAIRPLSSKRETFIKQLDPNLPTSDLPQRIGALDEDELEQARVRGHEASFVVRREPARV
jgi:hypothetical protein